MRSAVVFILLIACLSAAAQEAADVVTIDIGVADPTARTYAVKPGKKFDLTLINAVPEATYEIVNDRRREKATQRPTPDASIACTTPSGQVGRILKDVKTEAEVAKALSEGLKPITELSPRCTEAQMTAIEAEISKPPSATFAGYTLKAGETMQKTFKREGADQTWSVAIVTQGGSAATTAAAANKAANPTSGDNPNLDRLLGATADSTKLTTGECFYAANTCTTELHINADQVSTLIIKDIRAGKVKVTVTAGELFNCRALSYNFAVFENAPDRMIIPLHMAKSTLFGVGSTSIARQQIEAAKLYGLDFCPGTGEVFDKRRFGGFQTDDDLRTAVKTRYGVPGDSPSLPAQQYGRATQRPEARQQQDARPRTLADLPDPRTEAITDSMNGDPPPAQDLFPRGPEPQTASLPLLLRGRAPVIDILFEWSDGERKSFTIPVRYQRFWLDAGGFFVFTRHTNQRIETEVVPAVAAGPDTPATPERRRVTNLRSENSYAPSTGIVLNIHPGNNPILAFQFGIAANQNRLPSYYLGVGVRAREIGRRGLATIAMGVAMQQEAGYSQIAVGETVVPDSPRLQATQKYGFTFPYVSISLGFSFGGVSERTNVASSVTTAR